MGTRIPVFEYTRNQPKNGLKPSQIRLFFICCQIFGRYLMIFQSSTAPLVISTLKNLQLWQKFGKKLQKAFFNLRSTKTLKTLAVEQGFYCVASTHFSMVLRVPSTQKPGFAYTHSVTIFSPFS